MSRNDIRITHLGGGRCVTGSCHLVRLEGLNILVDCGLTQGDDAAASVQSWPVPPSRIDFCFLTHAHIDHIGRLPELVERGFRGEILTTHGTKALLGPMLEDALGFSGRTSRESARLLERIDELSWGFEYGEVFDLPGGARFKLGRAGHILGSCFLRLERGEAGESVVFSGDLGARSAPLLPDPDIPDPCVHLVLESTYGDRLHEDRTERVRRLGEALSRALADGGKVLVPAFALGRTQELVYEMDRLFSDPDLKDAFPELNGSEPLPVCIDSPLGLRITEIYGRLSQFWDKEAQGLLRSGDHPIDFEHLYAVSGHEDHLRLLEWPGPGVILAGSGMCTGGRIVNHLQNAIEAPENDVFFVGYQARGTPGRDILRYSDRPGGYVVLDGRRRFIRAKVHKLTGYSAHADQRELVEWVSAMDPKPGSVRLVHGEAHARRALAGELQLLGHTLFT